MSLSSCRHPLASRAPLLIRNRIRRNNSVVRTAMVSVPLCREVCRSVFLAGDPAMGHREDISEGAAHDVGLPNFRKWW